MAKFTNRERALKRIRALGPEVVKTVHVQMRREAEDLADAMRRAVPILSGALKDSIRVEDGKDEFTFLIKAGGVPETRKKVRRGVKSDDFAKAKISGGSKGEFDYARAVEFGHIGENGSQVPAQPFFFPTYRARKKPMRRRVSKAAKKGIEAAIKK